VTVEARAPVVIGNVLGGKARNRCREGVYDGDVEKQPFQSIRRDAGTTSDA
jgi:hypothetical protein